MPRIPNRLATVTPLPFMSPEKAAKPYEGLERAGQQIYRAGIYGLDVLSKEKEAAAKEQEKVKLAAAREQEKVNEAEDDLEILRIDSELANEHRKIEDNIIKNDDYRTVEKQTEEQLKGLYEQYKPKDGSPRLTQAYERAFKNRAATALDMAQNQKYKKMTEQGQILYDAEYDKAINDSAYARTEEERNAIRDRLITTGDILTEDYILTKKWVDDKRRTFDVDAKNKRIDLQDVQADKDMEIDQIKFMIDINDPNYIPDLPPKVRQNKIDRMWVKIRQSIAEDKQSKAEVEARFKEDQKNLKSDIYWEISHGRPIDKLLNEGKRLGLVDDDIIKGVFSFQNEYSNSLKSGSENPNVKANLTLGTYGDRLTTTEEDLNKALKSGNINGNTYKEFLGHRTSRLKSEADTTKKRNEQTYEINKQAMNYEFTMEGPGAAVIDREAKALHAEALREYYGVTHDPSNPVDPDKAYDAVMYRYRRTLDGIKDRESKKLRRAISAPNNQTATIKELGQWLLANESKMPKATFDAQVRMLRSIEYLEQQKNIVPTDPSAPGTRKKYEVGK